MSNTETKDKRLTSNWIRKDLLERLLVIAKREGRSQSFLINKSIEYALNALERGVEP